MTAVTFMPVEVETLPPHAAAVYGDMLKLALGDDYGAREVSFIDLLHKGVPLDDLLTLAMDLGECSPHYARRARSVFLDCAANVVHLYNAIRPNDPSLSLCIAAMREYMRGDATLHLVLSCADNGQDAVEHAWEYYADAVEDAPYEVGEQAENAAKCVVYAALSFKARDGMDVVYHHDCAAPGSAAYAERAFYKHFG
jgi:hypothetical protein